MVALIYINSGFRLVMVLEVHRSVPLGSILTHQVILTHICNNWERDESCPYHANCIQLKLSFSSDPNEAAGIWHQSSSTEQDWMTVDSLKNVPAIWLACPDRCPACSGRTGCPLENQVWKLGVPLNLLLLLEMHMSSMTKYFYLAHLPIGCPT